jgi:tetratricopeptide (TPR) repeat protein
MKKRSKSEKLTSIAPPGWPERLRQSRVALAVCGLALAVYSRSLFCGFVRDDVPQIVNNPQVQSWQYLPQILTSRLWSHMAVSQALFYRPLFSLWMLVIYTLGGLSPWFWHLSSALLHVACTYLVYRLSKRLLDNELSAGLAAALFAVHPIHVDAVSWVSASCEILFSMMTLGAVLILLRPRESNEERLILLSAGYYFASLFAKETGAALIVLLIAMAWVRFEKDDLSWSKRLLRAGGPYLSAAGIYLLIRWSVMHNAGGGTTEHNWREVFFTSPSIIVFYLRKMILPIGLSGGYVNPTYSSPTLGFWLPLAAILLLLLAPLWGTLRGSRAVAIAAAFILLPLLPALSTIRFYPQGDMTHDRYLYLPSVGLCLLVGAIAQRMLQAPKGVRIVATGVAAIALVALSALTFAQQRYYDNDLVFLQREIDVNPGNAFPYALLGNIYMDQGNTDLAFKNFRTASALAPGDPRISLFLARALAAIKNYGEAEIILNGLLLREDFDAGRQNRIRLSLANVEIGLGKLDEAQILLQRIEQADSKFPELHWALGVLYQKQGQLPLAQAEFEKEYQLTGDQAAQRQSIILSRRIYSTTPAQSR